MLKNVRKSKILSVLVVVALVVILFGNVYALATEDTNNTSTPLTITPTISNNTEVSANNVTNTNTDATNRNTMAVNTTNNTAIVSAATNNANVNNTNTNTNNTSTYRNVNSTTNTSNLPYTGTSNTKAILLVVALIISAVYAYKKVSDYNI